MLGGRIIALRRSKGAEKMRDSRPFFGVPGAGQTQNSLQPGASLGQVFPHIPESKQGDAEAQAPVKVLGLEQPVKSGAEVIDFPSQWASQCAGLAGSVPDFLLPPARDNMPRGRVALQLVRRCR